MSEGRIAVVGGGLAGAAAAMVLAERGLPVTLLEREAYLGGRVGAWTERFEDGAPFEMERGFHAFFRQYYNLRAFLRRIDPGLHQLLPLEDYPLLGPGGAQESFTGLPRRAPWNVMALVWRTPRLGLRDLTRVNRRAAMEMLAYDGERTYRDHDEGNARDYLHSLDFPPDARDLLFNVFAHSFFNPEEGMSAADLIMMFHFYFMGNPEGLIFDVLREPFSLALWNPMQRYLEKLGVEIRLSSPVETIHREGEDGWRVELTEGSLEADAAVLALDVPGLKRLVEESPDLDDPGWRSRVAGLDVTLPFAVWRLYLDRPPRPERAPFVGTTNLGELDNASLYERFEGESRRWALATGGSVVELHAYATPQEAGEEELRLDLRAQLDEIYPELAEARILEDRFLLRQDCPAFAPGSNRERPVVESPIPGIALAGDFIRLPFPSALMERAVASGFLAANHLMKDLDKAPEPVRTVPLRGLAAGLFR